MATDFVIIKITKCESLYFFARLRVSVDMQPHAAKFLLLPSWQLNYHPAAAAEAAAAEAAAAAVK
jgi:hypothetical protein